MHQVFSLLKSQKKKKKKNSKYVKSVILSQCLFVHSHDNKFTRDRGLHGGWTAELK